jgi:hypothetical protein
MRGGFGQQSGWQTSKRAKAKRAAASYCVYPPYGVSNAWSEQGSEARAAACDVPRVCSLLQCGACQAQAIRFAGGCAVQWQESSGC